MTTTAAVRRSPSKRLSSIVGAIFWVALALALSCVVVALALRMHLKRDYVPGGPPPVGYESENELYGAYLLQAFSLIDREPPLPKNVRFVEGVTYARMSGQELKLDLYIPEGIAKEKPRPLFVLIHGGGWKSGHRRDYRPHAVRVSEAGYVVASLSYRLSGTAKFPAQIRDVNAALQFLADHADEYGIDRQKIVVMGGSAGGHLAMMAGYADDPNFLPDAEPTFEPVRDEGLKAADHKIAAVFNFYGPSDLTTTFALEQPVVPALIGLPYPGNEAAYEAASPLKYISTEDPPTLIVHGTLDETVPVGQSDKLAEMLFWARVPVRYERLRGWPHTMELANPVFAYLCDVILEELARHVGRPTDE